MEKIAINNNEENWLGQSITCPHEVQHLLKPQSVLREPALAARAMALMGT